VEVLERNFFWPQEELQAVRPILFSIAQHVTPHLELSVVEHDPDDDRILECSQASRSDYIVTSDKHLLDLKQYAGARIIQPMDFLVMLQSRKVEKS
jgi:predicted nucleic acid-binding protein